MAYSSDAIKKEYKKETDAQRTNNLKRIRENIACLSLSDFAKATGITKNDLSMLENGDKLLSLFHSQAYKKYFLDNHNINISMDYLMGFTDIIENNNQNYQKKIGLSNDAIETLTQINNKELEVINKLLSDTNKTIYLLNNIRHLIFDDVWKPCVATYSEDNPEKGTYREISNNAELGFLCDGYGLLTIDDSLLKSHAMLKIQEVLNSYKGE